jgi:hypothetical protein
MWEEFLIYHFPNFIYGTDFCSFLDIDLIYLLISLLLLLHHARTTAGAGPHNCLHQALLLLLAYLLLLASLLLQTSLLLHCRRLCSCRLSCC